jgi:hypothetical protein
MSSIEILDQPADVQGDIAWRGFRSRPDPTTLPPGISRYLENMRCEKDFRPRAGTVALATDLVLVNTPAVLDFDLPTVVSVSSMTRAGATVTVTTATNHGYSTGNTVAIDGATEADYIGDWTITVTGLNTFTFSIGAATPTSPATGTITCAKGIRIFTVADDRVRAACVYTDDDNTEHVLIATGNKAYAYNEGAATVAIDYPSGETVGTDDEADLVQHLSSVYLFRGRAVGSSLAIASITRAGSTVTVTTTPDHDLATNDWVRMTGQSAEDYRGVYQITKTGAKTFTYDIGAPTPVSPAATAGTCYQVRPVLKWDRNQANDFVAATTGTMPSTGHIRIPPADWGIAFNRQLILPYARDEGILSGFGVDDDFDVTTLNGQFKIKTGGNDWLVGAIGTARTRILAVYRRSAHLVSRNIDDLTIDGIEDVPSAAGCVARRTITICDDVVLWLSDKGVQVLRYVDQLNLAAEKEPLSAPVQDLVNRINWTYAHRAVAAYHDNRFYLALPLDDSAVNNRVLVFNFLNRSAESPLGEWESLDSYPGDFDVAAMLVLGYGDKQELHYLTTLGGLYVAHQGEQDEYGAPGSTLGSYDIEGVVQGRRQLFGTLQPKRFASVEVSAQLDAAAQVQIALTTKNPDTSRTLRDHTATAAEDRVFSCHPRSRGESGAIDLTLPAGRPIIRAATLGARVPGKTTRDRS